jgi:hypothetical protein
MTLLRRAQTKRYKWPEGYDSIAPQGQSLSV